MNAELSDDCRQRLQILADKAKEMEECLVEWFGDQTPKLQKGCFAKVFASVRLFSVTNRARHWEGMAKDFMTRVRSLSSELAPSSEGNREKTRQRMESDIVGRGEHVKVLVDRLTDGESNLRVISVVGKQHCGKTAVVRSVFNMPKIKQHFDRRAWLHVTCPGAESYWKQSLLVDILKQTAVRDPPKDLEHKDEEQLCEMLHKSLMEQRYLIVLDNWGDVELFNELLIPFVDSKNGSRVIVTTRKAELHNYADPWTPDLHFLPDLTNKECEDLLHVSITGGGNSIDDDSQLKMTIKEEILSKCNGSPPAISLLGGLLSTVKVSKQAALIKQLKNRPTLEDIMRLSFDELPSIMKICVLYMALYPEESEVPTRRLFRQWAAEWLLAEAAKGLERSLSAEDCFRQLERRNLICVVRRKPDGSTQSCRMPAFLHEFFRQKAKEFGLLRIEEETRVTGPNPKHSAQHQQVRGQTPAEGHYSCQVHCLRSFALFNTSKLETQGRDIVVLDASQNLLKPKLLDRRLYLLRVLDLEGVYKPVLPENFGNILSNLRYLGLRWTILDSIPESVRNLLLLETLDLKHTNITKVTSAIWNAKNLRHLYLSEASFGKSIPHHIISGKPPYCKLETLWGLFIETGKSPMIRVLKKLRSLKKLGVTCRPGAVKAVTECFSSLTRLESLRLRSRDLLGQPAVLNLSEMKWPPSLSNVYLLGSLESVPSFSSDCKNLKALTLSMSRLKGDPMEALYDLEDLIVLRLLARSFTGKSLNCKSGFPKLRILKLWMLEELEVLFVKQGAMRSPEELEIRQCEKLGTVDSLNHIDSLKNVSLTGVDEDLAKIWKKN
ncbi:hypothetical protein EUGRSUZ_J02782 [Eucalyptus grandis]|uniref:Uncharacterized protein n=2 Tax=Eucalyptus grandis TaxID=71139 RepID=A0A059AI56_EUCGR|nr:hypothetical protein EUGRSUZ_J02782 [Eucalyptus grandis]